MDTLVLNADGSPLSLLPLSALSWQDSIKLLYSDKVDVIEYYSDWYVRSPSISMQVPSIVILKYFVNNFKKPIQLKRMNIYLRDNFICQYCGLDCRNKINELTLDHYIPRALGGKSTWDNLVTACRACNTKKAHHTNIKPFKLPHKPSYYELLGNAKRMNIKVSHESWIQYMPWEEELIKISMTKNLRRIKKSSISKDIIKILDIE